MKRALRVCVLGPIYLIAGCGVLAAWPLIWFLAWITNDPIGVDFLKELAADARREIWNGRER